MITIKIVLNKVKVKFDKNEVNDLLFLIQRVVTIETDSSFEAAYIHVAWLNLLKEVAVKLMDKNVEKIDKEYKVSISQAQYMALMELFQYGYPENYFDVFANAAYNKLIKIGVESKLIQLKGGSTPTPLLNSTPNQSQNLLNYES